MFKVLSNIKVILMITAIAVGILGANILSLKSENNSLSVKNGLLKKENINLASANQTNLITIESLQSELLSFNEISNQQAVEFELVENSIATDKQILQIELKAEANEKNIQWADISLPDSVAIMLNNTRNNHSNKSGSNLSARNIDQRYSDPDISRKNKFRFS